MTTETNALFEDSVRREMLHADGVTISSQVTTEVIHALAQKLSKGYLETRAMVMAEVDRRRNLVRAMTARLTDAEREELTQLLAPLATGQPELLGKEDACRINELVQLLLPPEEGR